LRIIGKGGDISLQEGYWEKALLRRGYKKVLTTMRNWGKRFLTQFEGNSEGGRMPTIQKDQAKWERTAGGVGDKR